jgi:predicted nucleic acid-binding protein
VARRHIFDARLALTLLEHGVKEFATRNTRDFESFGFLHVFDPLDTSLR